MTFAWYAAVSPSICSQKDVIGKIQAGYGGLACSQKHSLCRCNCCHECHVECWPRCDWFHDGSENRVRQFTKWHPDSWTACHVYFSDFLFSSSRKAIEFYLNGSVFSIPTTWFSDREGYPFVLDEREPAQWISSRVEAQMNELRSSIVRIPCIIQLLRMAHMMLGTGKLAKMTFFQVGETTIYIYMHR